VSSIAVVLVFVGIPLVVVATVFALVYGLSSRTDRHDGLPDLRPQPDGRAQRR
jgi:hypothetical protein